MCHLLIIHFMFPGVYVTEDEYIKLSRALYERFDEVCIVLGVDSSVTDRPRYSMFDRMLAVFKYKRDQDVTREELIQCLKRLQPPCHKAVLYLKYETKEEELAA